MKTNNKISSFFLISGLLLAAGLVATSIIGMDAARSAAEAHKLAMAAKRDVVFTAQDFAFDAHATDTETTASLDSLLVEPAAGIPNQKHVRLFEDTLDLYEHGMDAMITE